MTFYNVWDMDRFFGMVDRCRGPLLMRTGNGQEVDLRCNSLVRELMEDACGETGIRRLTVTVGDRGDLPMIFDYLMSVGCVRR